MSYLSVIPRRARQMPARWGLDFDRFFDDFFRGFELSPTFGEGMTGFTPRMDLFETDKEVRVTAELPGLEEKDIEVALEGNLLTLKGEKKGEQEEKGKNFYRHERTYGAFFREIEVPAAVDAAKVEAKFKNGVLTVVLPKSAAAKEEVLKIPVKAS